MSAPGTNFYIVGGTLRYDSPSYVERQADRDLYDGLSKGEFCYVLTSRQIGKSSLMVRTANKLRQQGVSVVVLDLTAIGQNLTPEQWYDGFSLSMGRQLRLEDELEDSWKAHARLSPVQRFMTELREVVLRKLSGPIVIFIDEIDNVRSLPFSTDEFFAAIRECHNRRSEDAEFNRLTFCLLGVATPTDLIRDTRITPFNIGRRIELNDFTPNEAAPLANGLRRDPNVARPLFDRIYYWTNGHPYLTQRLCRAVAEDEKANTIADVDGICETLFLSNRARERDDNLLFVRERLLRSEVNRADLLSLYDSIRRGKRARDDEASRLVCVLRLSGIVRADHGTLQIRNRIYQHVFDADWVLANMPDQEMRRQRQAFRRGLLRGSVVVAIFLALGLWTFSFVQQRLEDREIEEAKRNLGRVYRNMDSYSDVMAMNEEIVREGGSRVFNLLSFTLRAQKPNKFYLEIKISREFAYDVVLHSDGQHAIAYWPKDQQYRVVSGTNAFAALRSLELRELNANLLDTIYPLIFSENPQRAFAERAKNVRFSRKAEFEGVPAYVFTWTETSYLLANTNKPVTVTAWIARSDGRVLQLSKNLSGIDLKDRLPGPPGGRGGRGGRGRPRGAGASEFVLWMKHSDIQINPEFSTNEFEFTLPAEAKAMQPFPTFSPGFPRGEPPPGDRGRGPN